MPQETEIGWSDLVWNLVIGCDEVSPGCDHCYARAIHSRFHAGYIQNSGMMPNGRPMPRQFAEPFSTVQVLRERLEWPLTVKKPARIFVNSMSDLFHSKVPEDYIHEAFDVMRRAHWHTFIILTKRAGRLRYLGPKLDWAPNIWPGVSIESDLFVGRADALRIGAASASVRLLSLEPLLSALPSLNLDQINWVIVGSESGIGARPMRDVWVQDLKDRCVERGIPFFFKQRATSRGRKIIHPMLDGQTWEQFPPVETPATAQPSLFAENPSDSVHKE